MMSQSPNASRPSRKREWKKCSFCRDCRKKCHPVDRQWPGQKCENCKKKDLPCGPNMRKTVKNQITENQRHDARPPAVGNGHAGRESSLQTETPPPLDNTPNNPATSTQCQCQRTQIFSLRRRLSYLEQVVFHSKCDSPRERKSEVEDIALQYWGDRVKEELLQTLTELEKIGDSAVDKQDWLVAGVCYDRILKTLDKINDLNEEYKCHILEKIGTFFCSIEDYPEAEAIYNRIRHNHDIAKRFVEAIEKTSQELQRVLNGLSVATTSTMYGSLRVSLEAKYLFLPIHRAVRLGKQAVVSMIQVLNGNYDNNVSEGGVISENNLHARRDYIGSEDTFQRTPLFLAVVRKDLEVVKILLSASREPDLKVLVNARDLRGHTMLEMAAAGGDLGIVAGLISAGAEVNPKLSVGASSPLQAAAANGHLEVTKCLLSHEADVLQQRHDDKNALRLAEENGHREIAEILRSAGWRISGDASSLSQENLMFGPFLHQNSSFSFDSTFSAMEIDSQAR